MNGKLAAGIMVVAAAVPSAAFAKGGDGGGGAQPVQSGPCATLTTDKTGFKVTRNAPIELRFTLASCSGETQTVSTAFTQTSVTVGPPTAPTCTGPSWTTGPVTLAPGQRISLRTEAPASGCPVGSSGRQVTFDATTVDVASGTVLARASAFVRVSIENF